jgi:hypothetical protein
MIIDRVGFLLHAQRYVILQNKYSDDQKAFVEAMRILMRAMMDVVSA